MLIIKRFHLLIGVVIVSLLIFGGIIFFSDGNKNTFTQSTPPPYWALEKTVGVAELYLPKDQYQLGVPTSNSSLTMTSSQQVFLPLKSPSSAPYMTITHMKPAFWLGWGMRVLEPENSNLFKEYMERYQTTYTRDREKEGVKVQWNSEKVAGMEKILTPMKIVGLNLVLYLEGTLTSAEGQTFVHQHYCWVEKDQLYLISVLYPKPLEKQTQPVVNQIIKHFKIR